VHIETFQSMDLGELVDVWNRNLVADPISAIRLGNQVLLDPNFRDEFCLVARENGSVIGFVLGICGDGFHFPGRLEGDRAWILGMAVDLEYRRNRIGSRLLQELESRFRNAGKRNVWMASYPTAYIVPGVDENAYSGGLNFLQRRGYRIAYTAFAMDSFIWPPKIPGIVLQREEELASRRILFCTYSSLWLSAFRRFLRSHVPWDWEYLALKNLGRISEGTFSPEQFHLATFEDEVVGYCQHEGEHFGPFGVAQEFQRRGLGTVLLAHTLRSMSQQGLHNAWVLWTGEETARLYERFGFKKTRRFAVLHKEL